VWRCLHHVPIIHCYASAPAAPPPYPSRYFDSVIAAITVRLRGYERRNCEREIYSAVLSRRSL